MAVLFKVSAVVSARGVSTGRLRVRVLLESNRSLFPLGRSGSDAHSVVSDLLLVLVRTTSRCGSSRRLLLLDRYVGALSVESVLKLLLSGADGAGSLLLVRDTPSTWK